MAEKVLQQKQEKLKALVDQAEKGSSNAASIGLFDVLWDLPPLLLASPSRDKEVTAAYFKLLTRAVEIDVGGAARRLIIASLVSLYSFDATSSLMQVQRAYAAQLANPRTPASRISGLIGVARLFAMRGAKVANLASDSTSLALRYVRAPEAPVRLGACAALRAVVEGAGSHILPQLPDVVKSLRAVLTERSPGTVSVRVAAAECLTALARIPLSREQQEPLINTAQRAWDDPAYPVRTAAASAVGLGVALAVQRPKKKRDPQQQQSVEWTLESAVEFFSTQLMRAGSREARAAAAYALVSFTKAMRPDFLQKSLSAVVTAVLSLLSRDNLRALPGPSDVIHTRQLVCFAIRSGMSLVLDEVGQLSLLKLLVAFVRKHAANEQVAAAALQELSALLAELGEGAAASRDSIVDAATALFSATSREVRLKAALCLRHVGAAVPAQLAPLLSTCISTANMAHAEIANSRGSEAIRQQLAALEGAGVAAAGLLASVPSCPLGVPHSLRKFAYKTARSLVSAPQTSGALGEEVAMTRREVGWSILGSVLLLGQAYIERKVDDLAELIRNALSVPAAGEAMSASGYKFRAFPLQVLNVFLHKYADTLLTPKLAKDFVASLAALLKAVPRDQPEATVVRVPLMRAFSLLQPATYASVLSEVIRSCTSELAYGVAASDRSASRSGEENSAVDPISEDPIKRDPIDDYFPQPGASLITDPSAITAPDLNDTLSLAPALPLSVQLVDGSVELFPVLFASQAEKNRSQLVEYFIGQLAKTQGKERLNLATNACAALAASLRFLSVHKRALLTDAASQSRLPVALQELFLGLLADENGSLRRVAAEGLGLLAAVDGERYTERVLNSVIGIIRTNKDNRVSRSAAATALGCIARSTTALRAGGQVLALLVGTLHSLVRDEVASLHTEALHALRMTTDAAGPAFCGFASPTLSLLHSLLVTDAHDHPPALQALGSALNAVVAAMGPELQADSPTSRMCNAICDQLKSHEEAEVRLQSVQNRQMLVLFAPHTIDVASLQPMLKEQLNSTHANLRLAGVVCLRQLLSTHPETVAMWRLEEQLLQMYDSEREASMRRELMLLLTTLMDIVCGRSPSAWLSIFKRIIGSNQRSAAAASEPDDTPKPAARGEKEEEGDEDEGGGLASKRGGDKAEEEAGSFNPRLRTKVFAIEGVRRVIALAAESKTPAHFNLQLARAALKSGKGDFLVSSLADIVTMAYRTSTAQQEALRPAGIGVIKDLVEKFADQLDADVEGVGILDQYQAQIASALKPSFTPDALPLVTCAACQTVLPFLNSNISLDNGILKRLVTLLTSKVEKVREIHYANYSEASSTRVQLAVLFTLAQLRIHAHKAKPIADSLVASLPLLRAHWLALLRDYAVLTNTSPHARKAFKPAFFSRTTATEVLPHFRSVWPAVLEATASLVDSDVWLSGRDAKSAAAAQAKEAKEGSQEGKDAEVIAAMLKESTPTDDHWLILGLTLQHLGLQGYYTPADAVVALRACRLALPPAVLQQKELFPLSLCQDIAAGLHTLVNHGEGEVRGGAVRLAAHLLCSLPPAFFQSPEELTLYSSLMELLFTVLASPVPADPSSLIDALNAVASLAPRIIPARTAHYLPLLLNALVRIFPAVATKPALKTSLDLAFKAVLASEWDGKEEILRSTLLELLAPGKEAEAAAPAILSLLEDAKEPLAAPLFDQASALLASLVAANSTRLSTLQWLRAQVTRAASAPQSPAAAAALQTLEGASPAVCAALAKYGSAVASADQMAEVKELAGLLILSYNVAPQPKKEALLSVAMPLLVGLLRPDQKRVAQHDLAIQLLLHLATAATQDFRVVLSRLPPAERTKLETSLRAAMQANAAPAPPVASAEPEKKSLRLDFSRYQ